MKNSALRPAIAWRASRTDSPLAQAAFNQLVDAMIDHYISWREECAAVGLSYENWNRADRRDRRLAFSAYVAALDREQQAAESYRHLTEQIALL